MLSFFVRKSFIAPPPSRHPRVLRHARLALLHARRFARGVIVRLTLLGGWTWIAAISLVGFETFDVLFLSFALAPEFLPLVIVGLAVIWFLRERIRAVWSRVRLRRSRVRRR
jgi:hypothetical protein